MHFRFLDLLVPFGHGGSVALEFGGLAKARMSAQALRRSVASQIEYWATLGQVVEHSGLTAQEAQIAIQAYEPAAREKLQAQILGDLTNRLMAADASGSLAQRVRAELE